MATQITTEFVTVDKKKSEHQIEHAWKSFALVGEKTDSSRQKLFHYHSIIESGPLSSLIFIESMSRLTLYI